MKKILVVEDSSIVMKVLKHVLSNSDIFQPVYATSFAEAKSLVEGKAEEFFAGLIDLNLPDAPNGEVVDYTLENGIPTIVLTGSFDEDRRAGLLAKGIVDYVTKEGRFSYEYALSVLERLIKNQDIKILVVDDSDTARRFIATLLRIHLYQVLEASDGVQAIKLLLDNPDVRLLITDFNMPRMDGCELVKNIRHKYEKTDLVIIGLSSEGERSLSARFIKNGANDFLRKPFQHEEFYCRVSHNVEFIELIESIRDMVNRDDLTGVYNRKYFYQHGFSLLEDAQQKSAPTSIAVIDVDSFRLVNEDYGNEVGDGVLKGIADELSALIAQTHFTLARTGSNEFSFVMPGLDAEKALSFTEKVRQILCSSAINVGEYQIPVSCSAGVSTSSSEDLDSLVKNARECLQRAKEAGGGFVLGED